MKLNFQKNFPWPFLSSVLILFAMLALPSFIKDEEASGFHSQKMPKNLKFYIFYYRWNIPLSNLDWILVWLIQGACACRPVTTATILPTAIGLNGWLVWYHDSSKRRSANYCWSLFGDVKDWTCRPLSPMAVGRIVAVGTGTGLPDAAWISQTNIQSK